MNAQEKPASSVPSASEYILDNFKPTDRIAVLVLNRQLGETTQRITTVQKASSPEFQAWLRYKNANGADIYVGMNALQHHASTRTKDDIEKISHVYLDLDQGGTASLEALENSALVPRPNYVLDTSPEKFQVVWKVEGMTIEEAESLNRAMVREFVVTRQQRIRHAYCAFRELPTRSMKQISTCRPALNQRRLITSGDFQLLIDSQDAPRHHHEEVAREQSDRSSTLSQSEHDWAYAKRALAKGDDPRRSHPPDHRLTAPLTSTTPRTTHGTPS